MDERPPLTDAEYRLIHGPWPHWMLQMGLVKLAFRAAAGVALCILAGLVIVLVVT